MPIYDAKEHNRTCLNCSRLRQEASDGIVITAWLEAADDGDALRAAVSDTLDA